MASAYRLWIVPAASGNDHAVLQQGFGGRIGADVPHGPGGEKQSRGGQPDRNGHPRALAAAQQRPQQALQHAPTNAGRR